MSNSRLDEGAAGPADGRFALALHGGADALPGVDYTRELAHMRGLAEQARDLLAGGAHALDVACQTVAALEASGLYIAGRGASPNALGVFELDAAVMLDGVRAGAVAALEGFESPVAVARAVLERSPHVMLAGEGAARFAANGGFARIGDPHSWFTPAATEGMNGPPTAPGAAARALSGELSGDHGTVGCVVRDGHGRLAAATSTGGVFGKQPGRVGDSPLIGAGTYAGEGVAVSCTGQGEYFILAAAAAQVAHRHRFGRQPLGEAAGGVIDHVGRLGGRGGLIAVGADGALATSFNSAGMKRACLHPDGRIEAAAA